MTSGRMVHIVDDDEAVRNALGGLLSVCGFTVHRYPSGRALLDRAATLPVGCILLDLRMPEMSGLEVQAELTRMGIDFPVIYLSAHGDVTTGVQAMKRGAVDFLEKPVREEPLLAALEQGFARLGSQRAERAAARQARQALATLTPREREVIELVVRGCRNREIAKMLAIALQTVKVHRMRGMTKMGVTTVPDLTRAWAAAAQPDASGD
jgi:two-component system response regulator FixJ